MSETEKTLPLDGWHRARGGRMVPFAGYQMPVQYEGIIAEHLWTRASAGLFDVSHMGQLLDRRPGRREGPRDPASGRSRQPEEGRLRYSLLLNVDGGIIDDLMVTRRGGHFYMVVNGATKHGDIEYLEAQAAARRGARPYEGAGPARLAGPEGGRRAGAAGARRRGARLHDRRRVRDRRRQGLDQPLGLYRRGRLRNLDPGARRDDGGGAARRPSPR